MLWLDVHFNLFFYIFVSRKYKKKNPALSFLFRCDKKQRLVFICNNYLRPKEPHSCKNIRNIRAVQEIVAFRKHAKYVWNSSNKNQFIRMCRCSLCTTTSNPNNHSSFMNHHLVLHTPLRYPALCTITHTAQPNWTTACIICAGSDLCECVACYIETRYIYST